MTTKKWKAVITILIVVFAISTFTAIGSEEDLGVQQQAQRSAPAFDSFSISLAFVPPPPIPVPEVIPYLSWDYLHRDGPIDEFIPNPAGMFDVLVVGEWIYFIYPVFFDFSEHLFPFLFRMRDDGNYGPVYLISDNAVHDGFIAVDDNVFFSVSTLYDRRHGSLHMITPDGTIRLISGTYDSVSMFDVSGDYIYYTYRSTTYGVGRYAWGLHRMNIDGSDRMFVGFLPQGVGIAGTFDWGFHIEDGWVYAGNFRMRLGYPATGLEEVQVLFPLENALDDGWIFYITDRIIMARSDGSEQIEIRTLFQEEGYIYDPMWGTWFSTDGYFWGSVSSVDSEWIYFRAYQRGAPHPHRVRFDGTELSELDENKVYVPVKFANERPESEAAQPDVTSLLASLGGRWVYAGFYYSDEIDRSVAWPLAFGIYMNEWLPVPAGMSIYSPIFPYGIHVDFIGPIMGPTAGAYWFDVDVSVLEDGRVEFALEPPWPEEEAGPNWIPGPRSVVADPRDISELTYYVDNVPHRMVRFDWERDARRYTVEQVDNGIRVAYVVGAGGIPRWHNDIMIYRSTVRGERGEQIIIGEIGGSLTYEFIDTTAEPGQIYYYSLWTDDWTREDFEWVLRFDEEWQLRVDVDAVLEGR